MSGKLIIIFFFKSLILLFLEIPSFSDYFLFYRFLSFVQRGKREANFDDEPSITGKNSSRPHDAVTP